jgi:hypothetical protein
MALTEQIKYVGKYDGRFWIPESTKDLADLQIDVTSRSRI